MNRLRSEPEFETPEPEAAEPAQERPCRRPERRPYRKPVPELRGQIKPSLLGSPPDPP